ncbi:MAG: CorA family divalent cation transporter [Peptococcaceae bacterium]|nr:CorA family divalent cation transporter [Peptococcaceae bacterium]
MQTVVQLQDIDKVAPHMKDAVFRYISEVQLEGFTGFDDFDFMSFDWYDIHTEREEVSRGFIYLDEEDLIFICRDSYTYEYFAGIFEDITKQVPGTNEQMLYRFFIRLFTGDMQYLENLEDRIDERITQLLSGDLGDCLDDIITTRQELLRLKRYYEQVNTVFDGIVLNDNDLLTSDAIQRINILVKRTDRYSDKVRNLQELVTQMQATYQSQLEIQQNDLMKIFTIITAIFLPLTLLVGWYGMNFVDMPELHWQYGYPAVIVLSIAIVIGLVAYFKHRKWL